MKTTVKLDKDYVWDGQIHLSGEAVEVPKKMAESLGLAPVSPETEPMQPPPEPEEDEEPPTEIEPGEDEDEEPPTKIYATKVRN